MITGIASDRLRERLLFEGTALTLHRTVTIAEHYEATLQSFREFSEAEEVKYARNAGECLVKLHDGRCNEYTPPTQKCCQTQPVSARDTDWRRCYRCGSTRHLANSRNCKAKHKQCSRCRKIRHFQVMCRSPEFEESARKVQEEVEQRVTLLQVATGIAVKFLVDTGSSVSIIMEDTYTKHFQSTRALSPPAVALLDYSNNNIPVKG